jgi:general secretion pathway protein K
MTGAADTGHARGRKSRRDNRKDGGYVTILVLTFASLMAAMVAATLNVARPSLGQAHVNIDDLQADSLIDAGVAAAGYAIYGGTRRKGPVTGLELPMETGTVRVSVLPEGGRIDLNAANAKILSGLYETVGTGALRPDEFAARVMDWRDANKRARPGGAENDDYASLGLDYTPRNGPFLSIEELMLIPGMTEADYDQLTPYITIFNPVGDIDPAGASVPVLMAVPGMTESEAANIHAIFADPDATRQDKNRAIRAYREYLTPLDNDVFRVRADAQLATGYTKSVETVLMSGFRRIPYYVLYWRVIVPENAPS